MNSLRRIADLVAHAHMRRNDAARLTTREAT